MKQTSVNDGRLKILLINYRYFLSGGPEKYMFAVKALLEEHGHEVIPFSIKAKKNAASEYERYFSDPIGGEDQTYFEDYEKTPKTMLQMLDRQFYSLSVKKKLVKLIKDAKPDVCYLLHHANKLSPSVISACKENKVPVVMRLSDFYLVCPSNHLLRNGKVCEECRGSLWNAVRHRCVKGSLAASLIKVSAMTLHRLMKVYEKVDVIVAPSKSTISKMDLKARFVHIPTFIDKALPYNPKKGGYALYVGRLEEEKGIMTAISALGGMPLKIVGKSGTDYDKKVKEAVKGRKDTEFLGPRYGKELDRLYDNARFVVVPSRWLENMPNVALEAMMHSRPILASNLGSLKEIVTPGRNGYLFDDEDGLRRQAKKLFSDDALCRKLGKAGHEEAITTYSPEKHYQKLIGTFRRITWKH